MKKNDGIKESTDSSTTIEDDDTRGKQDSYTSRHIYTLEFNKYIHFLHL